MAARGAQAKQDITNKILETFSGSFVYGKEIRIPYVEDGIAGQIKVSLTAAKVSVENENNFENSEKINTSNNLSIEKEQVPQEPTEEEKERLAMLLEKLGI